jgi:mono/diheme cytochrome c family protein
LGANGRNIVGARVCSIDGAINGTSVFPNGVPDMQFLQGQLSAADLQAISDSLNSNPATGQQRYITACAGCHGVDARGGRVGEGAKGANAGDILEAIREEGAMGFLGCLPASDVKDIGNYLKGSNSSRGGSEGRGGNRGRGGSKGRD